jgi:cbb3-type cytochrome c oxidase subunit III
MRYFLTIFVLCVLVVLGIAGRRGSLSRKPPLYIFPDMRRQLKLRPETGNDFFTNGLSAQLPVAGTIPRSKPILTANGPVYPYEDSPVNTGFITGTTNFVENGPLPVTRQLLERGRQRFTIYCSPCHGQEADGNGITKKIGAMAVVGNLHDKRMVEMPDGEIFYVITHGRNNMLGYGPQVPEEDRWAIIAYLRALQLSWLGAESDLTPDQRLSLNSQK